METKMANLNVSLPEEMKDWVERRAEVGRYNDESEYVRELIRKDQERQAALAVLQSAITEGIESGAPSDLDVADFKTAMRARHGAG